MTTFAHRFAAAFVTRDAARVLDLFTDDVVYADLFYGRVEGRAALRALFERMYAEGDRHEWTMTRVVPSEACTIAEWDFTFTVSAAAPAGAGRTLRFPGVSVFETREGRCHTYREHFDRAAALLAVGIRPHAVAGIVARRPTVAVTVPA